MTTAGKHTSSIVPRVWGRGHTARNMLIGVAIIALGALLGYMLFEPERAGLTISILVVLVEMLIIVNNPLAGMLVWLFLTSFIESWIEIPMGAGIPDLSFSRFIVAFLAIFMLARAAIDRFRFAPVGLVEVWIVAASAGIMIAAPLSTNPKGVLQSAITMHFVPFSLYFFAKNLVQNKAGLLKLFWVIAAFGFVAALYVIYEQTTGNILFLDKGMSLAYTQRRTEMYGHGLRVVRGLLGGGADFGRVFTCTIPVTFYLFFERRHAGKRVGLAGMIAVQFAGMYLTYNRTSWYTLLIGLTILQFFYPQFRKLYLVIVLVAAVTLWATWDQVTESTVVTNRVNSKVSTLEGREARWNAGFNMWRAKPILGWGFGRYRRESGRFRTDGDPRNFIAIENDYLHILVASGVVGFLPYLLLLLTPLVTSVRLFFRARSPGWSGFVKPETIAVYWAIILSFAIGSYTQIQTQQIVKMLPLVIAGAVVGTHERWLRPETERDPVARSLSTADVTSHKGT
jgi:O-antigen ligase